jgi:hypothetical protein
MDVVSKNAQRTLAGSVWEPHTCIGLQADALFMQLKDALTVMNVAYTMG